MHDNFYSLFDLMLKLQPKLHGNFRIVRRRTRRKKISVQSKKHFKLHKENTQALILERLEHYNAFYNFTYKKIFIKNVKSRWGSCSKRGNLNFNYRLGLISQELLDYVVVHELCHLGEFNHSQKFWDLVAKTIPDYKKRQSELRKIRV